MAKGYWIAHVDVTDADNYPLYVAASSKVIQKFGGRPIVRGGRFEAMEGSSRTRNVVVEFESYEKALAAYQSADYQEALKLRQQYGVSDFIVVEGA
ncbi:MAG: DUF1330 domain-containing protein [Parvularculaceae bacterium]